MGRDVLEILRCEFWAEVCAADQKVGVERGEEVCTALGPDETKEEKVWAERGRRGEERLEKLSPGGR